MKFPVYYRLTNGRLVYWTIPANEKESAFIEAHAKPSPGHGMLFVDEKQERTIEALQAVVSAQTGLVPIFKRLVIVDDATGNVLGATMETDDKIVRGCTLYENALAGDGWKRLPDGTFIDLNPPAVKEVVLGS